MSGDIPLYGALALDCRNQRRMLDSLLKQRPWFRSLSLLQREGAHPSAVDEAAREAVQHDRFNVLISDRRMINAGHGAESIFSLLSRPHQESGLAEVGGLIAATAGPEVAPYQLINHLPGNASLVSKANIIRSLNRQYAGSDTTASVFDVVPTTYFIHAGTRLRSEVDSPVLQQFMKRFAATALVGARGVSDANVAAMAAVRMPARQCELNLWIVKPASHTEGKHPVICASANDVRGALMMMDVDAVVQKYIERPFLVDGHKVSLRMFVLVNDSLDVFIARYVVCVLAPSMYVLDVPPNPHDAVAYDAYMYGHVTTTAEHVMVPTSEAVPCPISLSGLQGYIDRYFPDVFPPGVVAKIIVPRMKRVVIDAVRGATAAPMPLQAALGFDEGPASDPKLPTLSSEARDSLRAINLRAGHRGRRCFELYGADFVLDEDLRPWLMGFKENPRLFGYDEAVDLRVGEVVDQVPRLVVDPLYVSMSPSAVMAAHHTSTTLTAASPTGSPRGPAELSLALSEAQVYARAASTIPTGQPALRAILEAQAAGRQQHDSLQFDTLHPAALRFFAGEMGKSPSAAPVPSHWELVYRTMAADDVETPHHVDATLLAMRVASSAFDMSVALRMHGQAHLDPEAQLASALPPRSRSMDSVPAYAYRGVRSERGRLQWYRNELGLQPGDIVVDQHMRSNTKLPVELRVPDLPSMHGERIMSSAAFSMALTPPRPPSMSAENDSAPHSTTSATVNVPPVSASHPRPPVPTVADVARLVGATARPITPPTAMPPSAAPPMTLAGKILAEFDDVNSAALLKSKPSATARVPELRATPAVPPRAPRSLAEASYDSRGSDDDSSGGEQEDASTVDGVSVSPPESTVSNNKQALMQLLDQLAASTQQVAKLQKKLAAKKMKAKASAAEAAPSIPTSETTTLPSSLPRREMKSLSVREIKERATPRVDTGQRRLPGAAPEPPLTTSTRHRAASVASSQNVSTSSLAQPAAPAAPVPTFMRGTTASRERAEETSASLASKQRSALVRNKPWKTSRSRKLARTTRSSSPADAATDVTEDSVHALHEAVLDAQARMRDVAEVHGRAERAGRTPYRATQSKQRSKRARSGKHAHKGGKHDDDGSSLDAADSAAHEAAARLLEELIAANDRERFHLSQPTPAPQASDTASSRMEPELNVDEAARRVQRDAGWTEAEQPPQATVARNVRFSNSLADAADRMVDVATASDSPEPRDRHREGTAARSKAQRAFALAEYTSLSQPRFDETLFSNAVGAPPEKLMQWSAPYVARPAAGISVMPKMDITTADVRGMSAQELMTPDASHALGIYEAILRGASAATADRGSITGADAISTAAVARGRGAFTRTAPVPRYLYSDVVDIPQEPQQPPAHAVGRATISATVLSTTDASSTSSPQRMEAPVGPASPPVFRTIRQIPATSAPSYDSLVKAYTGEDAQLRTPGVLVSAVQSLEAAAPYRTRSVPGPASSSQGANPLPGTTQEQQALTVRAREPARIIFNSGPDPRNEMLPSASAASAYLSAPTMVTTTVSSKKPQVLPLETRLHPDRLTLLHSA